MASNRRRPRWIPFVAVGLVAPLAMLLSGTAAANGGPNGPAGLLPSHLKAPAAAAAAKAADDDGGETQELMDRTAQYDQVRTAPGATVSAAAFVAARLQAAALPTVGGAWNEVTNQPYTTDAVKYSDFNWSNSGSGFGLVSGRMTAVALDGSTIYAGGADGGVWKSTNGGTTWSSVFDQMPSLSIGAIAINPADHSVWVGTGEPNSSQDGYAGQGIYRSVNGGTTWQAVGAVQNSLVFTLTFDGNGSALAATSNGLLTHSTATTAGDWATVLKPDPNPASSPYRTSWITDVKVRPGTGGLDVVAALGWRGGTLPTDTTYNGFYESTTGANGTYTEVTPAGKLAGATDIGRTTFSYGLDGSLYAVIESSVGVNLKGVFKSVSGNLAGPWKKLADADSLDAAPGTVISQFEDAGVQSWYNQWILADPANNQHLYLGLEEVYESVDGGKTWKSISPYWNFGRSCFNLQQALDTCNNTAHADQHAAAISGGVLYIGNDGGVYSRPTNQHQVGGWGDLNKTLHTLQYYSVGVGAEPGGLAYWGGLQDNGTSLLTPGLSTMVQPFGGDGGTVLVDPANGDRAVNEYVYLSMARTENGGRAARGKFSYSTISPSCLNPIYTANPCDPNPRFIAPYVADVSNGDHWVAGGQMVWDNQGKGWSTDCSATACDWMMVHDLGAGKQTTSLGDNGATTYAGWCGNGCNPGGAAPFISGIDTNYGGTWHTVTATNLPNRIPTSIQVDPSNAAHAWVTFGAFSRKWIAGAGVGHVFVTHDGGATWTDISGNLPDAPATSVILAGSHLVVGTDIGVFITSSTDETGAWSQLGSGLPAASTNQVTTDAGATVIVAGTHGRGIWQVALS